MKKIIECAVDDIESLLGEEVLLMCMNYFYAGRLVGVSAKLVKLDGCRLVYETGEWSAKAWKDAQLIGDAHYVTRASIESFRKGK